MRRILFFLMAALTLSVPFVGANLARADETNPDCEAGQPPIGYGQLPDTNTEANGACEGEQWDGQDSVAPDFANGGDCTGVDGSNVALFECADPNVGGADPTQPAGLRSTSNGDDSYWAARAFGVGRAGVFASQSGEVSVYFRDDTPTNSIAAALFATPLAHGYASESDCSQTEYESSTSASSGADAPTCGRDNTAVTVKGDRQLRSGGAAYGDFADVSKARSGGNTDVTFEAGSHGGILGGGGWASGATIYVWDARDPAHAKTVTASSTGKATVTLPGTVGVVRYHIQWQDAGGGWHVVTGQKTAW